MSQWASALTLAGFMAGLGIGSLLAARYGTHLKSLLKAYIALEITVAIGGALLVLVFPDLAQFLGRWLAPLREQPLLLNLCRFGIAFTLFALPVMAMGAALPLWIRYCAERYQNFGQSLGRLYGWNTLGAVLGACLGEAILIEKLGIPGTALAAASANLMAAALAFSVRNNSVSGNLWDGNRAARLLGDGPAFGILGAAALSGALLLALEVVWFRFLQLFVLDTHLHFALMLAVVLAGIGLGSLLGGWWLHRRAVGTLQASLLAAVCGLAVLFSYAIFRPGSGSEVAFWHVEWTRILGLCIALMLIPSLLSGVLFTWLGKLLHDRIGESAAATGWLTFANTMGAAFGALLAGFWILPEQGMHQAILLLAISYGFIPVLLWQRGVQLKKAAPLFALVSALALSAIALPGTHIDRYFHAATEKYRAEDGSETVLLREGRTQTLQYLSKEFLGEPLYYRLVTNGYSMSATTRDSRRYMKLFAWWPAVVHGEVRDALLISYGVGMTAEALTRLPGLQHLDVVDISSEILESGAIVFPEQNPLRDTRVTSYVEDGRFFLHSPPRKYDLITGEPPPPRASGVVNLYTREYFELMRSSLKEGGMATYWLPVDQMRESAARAVLGAFCAVFPDCALWAGSNYNWMMTGSNGYQGRVSDRAASRLWRDPRVRMELLTTGFEQPQHLGATFIADAQTIGTWVGEQKPLTDRFPGRLSPALPRESDLRTYFAWMDDVESQARFAESEYIAGIWSEQQRAQIEPWFAFQSVLNNQVRPGSLSAVKVLDAILDGTSLRVPVLWLADSGLDRVRIADQSQRMNSEIAWHQAASMLAQRDFGSAADILSRYTQNSVFREQLRVYVLCRAGRTKVAKAIGKRLESGGEVVPMSCW